MPQSVGPKGNHFGGPGGCSGAALPGAWKSSPFIRRWASPSSARRATKAQHTLGWIRVSSVTLSRL